LFYLQDKWLLEQAKGILAGQEQLRNIRQLHGGLASACRDMHGWKKKWVLACVDCIHMTVVIGTSVQDRHDRLVPSFH